MKMITPDPPIDDFPQVSAMPPSGLRLSEAMLVQVIALANRLQTQHGATVSLAEAEVIGREVGIDAHFVRRAVQKLYGNRFPDE